MRLKKLEIRGFKTFADPTEVEFTPGITAFVGPNGSGKSNISDAIAWVMGESNIRNLRATRTEDVIFNGSAKRKAVGLAEVSLTLDNTLGKLPVSFSEVRVTRRAYRSGENEYFINKVPCRLRDIFELFLDSGAGRGAYSMVSQGEIDRLLTAKPEDRRELLEEAAGVKKYRHRRHESYRKLETTEGNLSRVNDIMEELQAQMEPLAAQAEAAMRYKDLTDRLREIEVGLLVSRVQKLDGDLKAWKETEVSLGERLQEAEGQIQERLGEERSASEFAREGQRQLEAAYKEFSARQAEAERLKSELAVADARRHSAEEGRERLRTEIARLEARTRELAAQAEELQAELSQAGEGQEAAAAETAALRTELDRISALAAERAKALEEQESGARGLAEDKAAQRSRLENCGRRIEELRGAMASCRERLEGLDGRRQTRTSEHESAAQAVENGEKRVEELSAALERTKAALTEAEDNLRSATAALDESNRELIERSGRLKTLREMHEAREGYYQGVKAVLAASARGQLPPDYAAVADILDVPSHLDQAVEAALGGQLQDIATPDFDLARQAIEFLKSRQLGRATFLPMDRLDHSQVFPAERLRGVAGMLGTAYELIGFEPRYEPVARLLLGRVLVAKDLQHAAEAARRLNGWGKIVTPDGELLVPSGAITGGSRQRRGAGLTERRREIADLTSEVRSLTESHEAAKAAVADLRAEQARLAGEAGALQREAEEARVSLARDRGNLEVAASSLRELEDAGREAQTRLESAEAQSRDLQAERTALEAMLSDSSAAGGALEEMLAQHKEELATLQAARQEAAEKLNEASSRLSALTERHKASQRSLAAAGEEMRNTEQTLAARRGELADAEAARVLSSEEMEELAANAEAAAKQFEEARVTLMTCQSRSQELSKELERVSADLRECREGRDGLNAELHTTQLSLMRAETELSQSLERLWEEYEINREDALSWPEPLLVKHGTAAEVARLRKEIRAMGDVNTGAVAEFERVRERWEFLAGQRSDLEEARESLLEAIREIDDSTRGMFLDTFHKVNGHFSEIFTSLFGGGEAKLELTQPENLLETGVEVYAQPPGKKQQSMDLLSGGEKTLTAQALLFALMRVRPSPFCVLDEVDAPLDEANVSRFADLVKDYARDSQFIIITHNRATMEAADVLYGVTMSEPGITRLISAKLTEA